MIDLPSLLGPIDIYLLDQVLRGRIVPGQRIFDAGCGGGRNLVYFLRAGFEVLGVDMNREAIEGARALSAELAPHLPIENFRAESIERSTFPDRCAEVVISSAVLHFSRDEAHFRAILKGSWRHLAPGGLFFCRLASTIGLESRFTPLGGRRFLLPEGSELFLVDQAFLLDLTEELGGELLDPIKTTVVQDRRCMTTWVVRRDG
ncbi:MAG: class I SAM-dependent methyltransferase [Acidobacteriota bacterium]